LSIISHVDSLRSHLMRPKVQSGESRRFYSFMAISEQQLLVFDDTDEEVSDQQNMIFYQIVSNAENQFACLVVVQLSNVHISTC